MTIAHVEGIVPDGEALLTEQECTRLVYDFAYYNDSRQYDRLALLFTEDASFSRPRFPDLAIQGRSAILASFQTRPADEMTRHVISNVRVTAESATRAKGNFYLVLYSAPIDPAAEAFGSKTDGRQLIAEVDDDYIRTAEGWRISRRRGRIVMHT